MRSALIASLFLITGCAATHHWVHPTKAAADREADFAECDLRAAEATASIRNGVEAAFAKIDIFNRCARSRGYALVPRQ